LLKPKLRSASFLFSAKIGRMSFLTILSLLHLLNFVHPQTAFRPASDCGDGTLYAWDRQTAGDPRFSTFPKITGKRSGPSYTSGDKAFDRFVRERLVLDEEARRHTFFVLNYYFTVNCDGTIGDVELLGDPVVRDWTNITSVIQHTRGWKPAEKNGKPVDCIYFRTLRIEGAAYR
jgi:hypothetical protein